MLSESKRWGRNLEFKYDGMGYRVMKVVKPVVNYVQLPEEEWTYTLYVRDATGNIMATDSLDVDQVSPGNYSITLSAQEFDIYGSSRLGTTAPKTALLRKASFKATASDATGRYIRQDLTPQTTAGSFSITEGVATQRKLGLKQYEITNHLGNVMATVSDRKILIHLSSADLGETGLSTFKSYIPDVITAQDYYPFGSLMPGRQFNTQQYRYGFNGKEKDDEVKGNGNQQDYGFRIYDPRIAKFLSVDPLSRDYPWYSPYQFAGNTPIQAIDVDGAEEYKVVHWYNPDQETCKTQITILRLDGPLTVHYYTRKWNNNLVPSQYLHATSGFSDKYQGSSTGSDPWKTEKERKAGESLLIANQPPQVLGDSRNDNVGITEPLAVSTMAVPVEKSESKPDEYFTPN